jgi:hypothetical protein
MTPDLDKGTQSIYTVAGTLIFDQRNKLAEAALNEGADYILWLDADMRFPKNTIERYWRTIKT